ncbi:uncharacterized protein LOC126678319 [Mercurialis annua]|uniref:uncharacterized protein LOC126678319 n=1 Tax=Mercurialis annua TaxID=3986 RepID=UPI00215FDFA2|nr:uncharacterized protein LOC126678319 [Mercurialis annua]
MTSDGTNLKDKQPMDPKTHQHTPEVINITRDGTHSTVGWSHQGPTKGRKERRNERRNEGRNERRNEEEESPENQEQRKDDSEEKDLRDAPRNGENQDDARSGLNSKREERKEKEDAPPKSKRQEKDAGKAQSKKKNQEDEGESSELPQKSKATYVAEEDLEEKIAKALKKLKSKELDIDDLRLKGSPLSPEIMEETIP